MTTGVAIARNWLLFLQRQKKAIILGEPQRFQRVPVGLLSYHGRGSRMVITAPRVKSWAKKPPKWKAEKIRLDNIRWKNREYRDQYDGCIFP